MRDVLIICEYPTLNGGERSMLSTLPLIRADGYRVQVAAPPAGDLAEELQRRGVEHHPLELVDADGVRLDQSEARKRVSHLLGNVRPSLVHANSLSMARLVGPVAADARIPSLGHIRDIVGLSRRAIEDVNQNSRLIAVSVATRDAHVANGLDAEKTFVVHNGVDLDAAKKVAGSHSIREELGIAANALLVVTVGQVIARKGADLFVDAALQLLDRLPNAHFLVLGECFSRKTESKEFVERLHEEVAKHDAQSRVHFLGYRSDALAIIAQADVVVQPSRQDPLCRVLLEAAACGRAIVTTDVGGTREIFPPECDAAIVIEPNDTTALSQAVDSLLCDSERRGELGRNARKRAEDAFDVRRATNELLRHYGEVASG